MTDAFDKEEIKDFLEDPNRNQVIVQYKGERLNAACDWWKLQGSLGMLLRSFLGEILMKAPPCSLKNNLYRLLGVKIGKDVVIGPNAFLDLLFPELIIIKDGVILGWGCKIFTHGFLKKELRLGRVCIKEGTVIGAGSTVKGGETIGSDVIVSLCSLVNKDIKNGETIGGVPAEPIEIKKHY